MSSTTTKVVRPPVVKADLSGKTVAVIGCNTGIGLETAKHFATMNPARVICACRSQEKAEATVAVIKETTGYTKAEPWVVELSNFKSVVAFADKLEKDSVALDIFVFNAGVGLEDFRKTADGWEEMLQVNHISGALLTLLVLPNLLRSAEKSGDLSRITLVSSGTHKWKNFPKGEFSAGILATLNDSAYFASQVNTATYPHTKLLNVLFARALTDHLPPNAPVIVDSVCPGFCLSDLRRNIKDQSIFQPLMADAKTSEEGSRSVIYAALGPEGATRDELKILRGGYVSEAKLDEASEWVLTEDGKWAQEEAWVETVKVVTTAAPKIENIVKEYASN